jgi:NADPH-dependent ferric siderophore reductase
MTLTVAANEPLGRAMRAIRLQGPGVAEMPYASGNDVMVAVQGDGRSVRRRYTIRRLDRALHEIEIDVLLHGGGPGARWASSVARGDEVEVIGPRGKITLRDEATWHLFVGDDAFLPATAAMVENVTPGTVALAVLEVDGAGDEQPLRSPAEIREVRWLHRTGAPGSAVALLAAVAAIELPDGPGHAYVGAEWAVTNEIQRALVDRGLTPDQISPKAYWRKGMANADHGEPVKT